MLRTNSVCRGAIKQYILNLLYQNLSVSQVNAFVRVTENEKKRKKEKKEEDNICIIIDKRRL